MNFLFAWRYFKSKKSTNAINIISWVSVVAIAIVSAAFILVLSVFNGFEGLVKDLYADFYADVRVLPQAGKLFTMQPAQVEAIKKIQGIENINGVIEEKAVLVNGDYQSIVYLKGVDDGYSNINKVTNYIVAGKFITGTANEPKLVLGAGIENAIAANVETAISPITIYLPNKQQKLNLNSLDAFNSANAVATGTFLVQQEFDNKYAFTNASFMRYMLDLNADQYSSIEIKLAPNSNEKKIANHLQQLLGNGYTVQTRYQQNQSLYTIMQIEKWVIYGILFLILSVAAFNIIGALSMLVLEKKKDIQILKAMGATNATIQKIFLTEGIMLACIGGVAGIILATIICLIQLKFKLLKLSGGTFIIDYYPVKMMGLDFVLSVSAILIIAIAAAWIPSKKAAIQPLDLKS